MYGATANAPARPRGDDPKVRPIGEVQAGVEQAFNITDDLHQALEELDKQLDVILIQCPQTPPGEQLRKSTTDPPGAVTHLGGRIYELNGRLAQAVMRLRSLQERIAL